MFEHRCDFNHIQRDAMRTHYLSRQTNVVLRSFTSRTLSVTKTQACLLFMCKVGQFVLHMINFSQMSFLTAPETHICASRNQTQVH